MATTHLAYAVRRLDRQTSSGLAEVPPFSLRPDSSCNVRPLDQLLGPNCPQPGQDSKCTCRSRRLCLHLGSSPIQFDTLEKHLKSYDKVDDASVLVKGFRDGFKIEYEGPRIASQCNNLRSAFDHPEALLDKIEKEVALGRMAGPFDHPPLPNLHISPVGVVPKSDKGWRLITHLSYPYGSSINDGIDVRFSSVHYT